MDRKENEKNRGTVDDPEEVTEDLVDFQKSARTVTKGKAYLDGTLPVQFSPQRQ